MNKPSFKINDREIGYEHPPLVIVEIGINHGGSLEIAKAMVDTAHQKGAEIIKHQTHMPENEMSEEAKSVIPGNTDQSIWSVIEQNSLSLEDESKLKAYVEGLGMIYISTPFSREAADWLETQNVPAYKIGSGEMDNLPLIEHIASFNKPIILSTGMHNLEEIKPAVEILEKYKVPYALLHCTNLYPTPPHLVRLGAVTEMIEEFPNAVIGLSDHSLDIEPCLGAIALGASVVERHYTDSYDRVGPDIVCSMDPNQLERLLKGADVLFHARGGSKNKVSEEQVTYDFARASVVAIKDIPKGEVVDQTHVWVKRPGTGDIAASDFEKVVGKTAKTNVPKGTQLSWDMLT